MPSRREYEALERYLARLERHLSKLPPAEREQAVVEIRQHLEALVEDQELAGAGKNDAVLGAVRRFGSARRIARMLYWESVRQVWRWRILDFGPPIDLVRFGDWVNMFATWLLMPVLFLHLSGWLPYFVFPGVGAAGALASGWWWELALKRVLAWHKALGTKSQATLGSGWIVVGIICWIFMQSLIFKLSAMYEPFSPHFNPDYAAYFLGMAVFSTILRCFAVRHKRILKQSEPTNG